MTDKGRRGGQAATNGSDGTKLPPALVKIFSGIEELRRDTDGFQPYSKLCETQTTLKQDLETKKKEIEKKDEQLHDLAKQKDDEIATLKKKISALWDFERRLDEKYKTEFRAWDEDLKRHSTDSTKLSQLKGELETFRKAADDANNQNKQLCNAQERHIQQIDDLKKQVSSLENMSKVKELQLEEAKKSLVTCQSGLKAAKDDLGILQSDPEEL
jgi:chromosome segregation ATPase